MTQGQKLTYDTPLLVVGCFRHSGEAIRASLTLVVDSQLKVTSPGAGQAVSYCIHHISTYSTLSCKMSQLVIYMLPLVCKLVIIVKSTNKILLQNFGINPHSA